MALSEAKEMMQSGYLMAHKKLPTFALWRSGNRIVRQGGLDITKEIESNPAFQNGWAVYRF